MSARWHCLYLFYVFSDEAELNKCQAIYLWIIPLLCERDDLTFSSFHKVSIHVCNKQGRGAFLSVSDQLEVGSQMNRTHLRVASHLEN